MNTRIDYEYLIGLLTDRKNYLINQMKASVFDKTTPLSTIRRYESELTMVETQIKNIIQEIE